MELQASHGQLHTQTTPVSGNSSKNEKSLGMEKAFSDERESWQDQFSDSDGLHDQESTSCGREMLQLVGPADSEASPSPRTYACDTCGKKFIKKYNLSVHAKMHTVEKEKVHLCDVCGKQFPYRNSLDVHYRLHTGKRMLTCFVCGKSFQTRSVLRVHLRIHGINELPEMDEFKAEEFSCDECGSVFKREASLAKHKRNCVSAKTETRRLKRLTGIDHNLADFVGNCYICKVCGRQFKNKFDIQNHSDVHTGAKNFTCEDCGRKFQRKTSLTVHLTLHTGDKKFACGECDKVYSTKSSLKKHSVIHTGEKNFICDICGKAFDTRNHMMHHMYAHTGERFVCDLCGGGYSSAHALKRHIKDKRCINPIRKRKKCEKPKQLECDYCHVKVDDKVALIEHYKGHIESKESDTDHQDSQSSNASPNALLQKIKTSISDGLARDDKEETVGILYNAVHVDTQEMIKNNCDSDVVNTESTVSDKESNMNVVKRDPDPLKVESESKESYPFEDGTAKICDSFEIRNVKKECEPYNVKIEKEDVLEVIDNLYVETYDKH